MAQSLDAPVMSRFDDFVTKHGRKFAMGAVALACGTFITALALLVVIWVDDATTTRETVELVSAYLLFAATAAGGFALTNAGVEVTHAIKGSAEKRGPQSPAPRPSGTMPAEGIAHEHS